MFEDALTEIEKSIQDTLGMIPVVFKGLTRNYRAGESTDTFSCHNCHEVSYISSGDVRFEIEGEIVPLKKGESILIRQGTRHRYCVQEGMADVTVVYFGFEKVNAKTAKREVSPVSLDDFMAFATETSEMVPKGESYIVIEGKNRESTAAIVEQILMESQSDAYGHDLMMQLLAIKMVIQLSRVLKDAWEESMLLKEGKTSQLMHIARDYILDHFQDNISVAEVASYVFLSHGYFSRAFRDEMGQSPMSFLISVRINHACELLKDNDIKISSIAQQSGFASPQRFNVTFRKYMGMTPMEYRKKYRQG